MPSAPPSDNPDPSPVTSNVYDILRPDRLGAPVVFASPHSGRDYPPSFIEMSRLDRLAVRRSEDAFVDELFASAPEFGAPLIRAHFPRAFIDANREPYELDPDMFDEPLPAWVNTGSPRVAAGLGTLAKIVAGGAEIYNRRLPFDEAVRRIDAYHQPYHRALSQLIDEALDDFGCCLLIDCHSMPSLAVPSAHRPHPDIVLGDCHGSSCGRDVTHVTEATMRELGLSVQRNKPYAGGYTTRHYARRHAGVQTLQIEINRGLYMDESRIEKHAGFRRLTEQMRVLISRLTSLEPSSLAQPLAAE